MAVNIRPLHDRVIVRRIEEGEQVRGGIIIPDTAKEKPQEGEVVAAGEGKYREDGSRQTLDVKVGDRVLFGKYSGSEVKIDNEELLIMREDEILGIIQRAAAGKKAGKSLLDEQTFSLTQVPSLTVGLLARRQLIRRRNKNGKASSSWRGIAFSNTARHQPARRCSEDYAGAQRPQRRNR